MFLHMQTALIEGTYDESDTQLHVFLRTGTRDRVYIISVGKIEHTGINPDRLWHYNIAEVYTHSTVECDISDCLYSTIEDALTGGLTDLVELIGSWAFSEKGEAA